MSPVADGLWSAVADPGYEAPNGMLGGWTAAIALRVVVGSAGGAATPSAMTINFAGPIPPGTDVHIRTRRLGGSRSVSHWQSEMTASDSDDVLAYASAVLTERRDSDGRVDVEMPVARDPETCEVLHPPGPFGERVVMHAVDGYPPFGRPDTRSLSWVRDLSGHAGRSRAADAPVRCPAAALLLLERGSTRECHADDVGVLPRDRAGAGRSG